MAHRVSHILRLLRRDTLGLAIALSLAACGSTGGTQGSDQNTNSASSPSSSTGDATGTTTASGSGSGSGSASGSGSGHTVSGAPLAISGRPPAQAIAGRSYAFQPATNAGSGSALVFSIRNKPGWAKFNAATGLLSGTPSPSQRGAYRDIAISVSDGGQSATLAAFSITVTGSAGSAALVWTPVTQNTNGSVLTDLAGYRIRYGTAANALSSVVTLSEATVTSYEVTGLSAGTWYFAVAAYTSTGVEGTLSNVGRATID